MCLYYRHAYPCLNFFTNELLDIFKHASPNADRLQNLGRAGECKNVIRCFMLEIWQSLKFRRGINGYGKRDVG